MTAWPSNLSSQMRPPLLLFCLSLMSCSPSSPAEKSAIHGTASIAAYPGLKFVKQGYIDTEPDKQVSDEWIAKQHETLGSIPADIKSLDQATAGTLWEQFNRRTQKEGLQFTMLFETNLPLNEAASRYLDAPIKTVDGEPVANLKADVLQKLSCLDLLYIIVQNSRLHVIYRKNGCVLSNYIHDS